MWPPPLTALTVKYHFLFGYDFLFSDDLFLGGLIHYFEERHFGKLSLVWSWNYASFLARTHDMVDGSEILRSPVELGSLSHFLQGFYTSQVVFSPDFWTINSNRTSVLLLMEEIVHLLRLVVYPIIYRVLSISGGWPDFWTISLVNSWRPIHHQFQLQDVIQLRWPLPIYWNRVPFCQLYGWM